MSDMDTPTLDHLRQLTALLTRYGELTGGVHNPIHRVFLGAVRNGAWAIGAAQCGSILRDQFSLRMLKTDEEEDLLRELERVFGSLQREAGQAEAQWDYGRGGWVLEDRAPRSAGAWALVSSGGAAPHPSRS